MAWCGSDAADALQEVQVLDVVAALGGLFDPAVDVAQAHGGVLDRLAVDRELKMARLLERGVLRPDGDDEALALGVSIFSMGWVMRISSQSAWGAGTSV
jgi:hypothetical protein